MFNLRQGRRLADAFLVVNITHTMPAEASKVALASRVHLMYVTQTRRRETAVEMAFRFDVCLWFLIWNLESTVQSLLERFDSMLGWMMLFELIWSKIGCLLHSGAEERVVLVADALESNGVRRVTSNEVVEGCQVVLHVNLREVVVWDLVSLMLIPSQKCGTMVLIDWLI